MSLKPPPGFFTILYFAGAKDYTHKEKELLEAPLEVNKLLDVLEKKYNGIGEKILSSCLLTVNLGYVDTTEETLIREGDEVAIIPPVSSG
ncbi:MAG: hypothetical protein GOMPHAMPRED_000541 [Gomphillus americanus]|uniref:Molybdopterin synthase sulfur carrier subunit n=1 Tax=Gomphillus americanus TaxID=1940652 RepID=A0A8H3EB39_9LECA|nr:MAG: hypothetical protein GOMPHAMPRED_000541 [Gomphillus americanus]